jgi:hypothetical protein
MTRIRSVIAQANLFVATNKIIPHLQAPRFICGDNPKSKIQNPNGHKFSSSYRASKPRANFDSTHRFDVWIGTSLGMVEPSSN